MTRRVQFIVFKKFRNFWTGTWHDYFQIIWPIRHMNLLMKWFQISNEINIHNAITTRHQRREMIDYHPHNRPVVKQRSSVFDCICIETHGQMKTYNCMSQISNDYRLMRRHLWSICKLIWLELNYTPWLIHLADRQIMKCDKIILATILKVFVMLQKLETRYWKVVTNRSSSTACESCEAF